MQNRPAAEPDAGFTLVELLTAMVLLMVLLTFVTYTVISTQKAYTRTTTRLQNAAELRTAFDTLTRTVRTAAALTSTSAAFLPSTAGPINGRAVAETGTECWFYANIQTPTGAPALAHYYVDASAQLVEQITYADAGSTGPNWTYTSVPFRSRVIAHNVVVPTGSAAPIFTYYSQTGTALNDATNVSTALPTASLQLVGDLGLRLSVQTPGVLSTSATLVNRVRLINADVAADTASAAPTP